MYIDNNSKVVMHPVFGEIRIEEKFQKVLDLPVFINLSHKSQLGTKALSGIINAKHTRLMHSIGVMYLVDFALKCIKENAKEFFTLNEREIEVLKLAALGHDLGHLAFSHSIENKKTKSHEERTVECFEKNSDEINDIFGYDITSLVLMLYKNKTNNQNIYEANINKILCFRSLIIGDIDCDRMEYIMTDSFLISGKKTDYLKILRHLNITLIGENISLVYDKKVLPIIINMLYDRYVLYDTIYYSEGLKLSELVIKEYIKLENISENQIEKIKEYHLLCKLEEHLETSISNDKYKRIAEILLQGKIDDCLITRIEDNKQFEFFKKRLEKIIENKKDVWINEDRKKLCICNKNNNIYIKDDDGVIKNILSFKEGLFLFDKLEINYNFILVDLKNSFDLTITQKNKIRDLFNERKVKIKKVFKCNSKKKIFSDFKQIVYNSKNHKKSKLIEKIYQIDKNDNIIIKNVESEDEIYTVLQIPQNDGSNFVKYYEYKFYNIKTKNEMLEYINSILESKNLETLNLEQIKDYITAYKQKYSVILENVEKNSSIKLSYISSNYISDTIRAKGEVVEAELLNGNEMLLIAFQDFLKNSGYVEVKKDSFLWMRI